MFVCPGGSRPFVVVCYCLLFDVFLCIVVYWLYVFYLFPCGSRP